MEACPNQLSYLEDLLLPFSTSTGLKVNFSKSMLVPINLSDDQASSLATSFGCELGKLPFTYLGLPMGLTKPKVVYFLPLVQKCERRLTCTSSLLSQAGRREVTNSIFTAMPMFFMYTFKLHKTVIKQVDKYRKHCLWRGSDINAKQPPKAAWEMVCLAKKEGGLGVLNLRTQNDALLLKHLHKFFNRCDIPWVNLVWELYYSNGSLPSTRKKGSFWWSDILKLLDSYKGMAMVTIRDGVSCLFWDDMWLHRIPRQAFPELFSFARNPHISVSSVLDAGGPASLFHLPISQEAFQQLHQLAEDLNGLQETNDKDIWTYIWGSPFFLFLQGIQTTHWS